jgi:hypothetical protein
LEFLKVHLKPMDAALAELIKVHHSGDPFGAQAAFKTLETALSAGKIEDAAVAHASLMNKLDSFQTMLQLATGDPADILQMVRWQKDLYTTVPQLKQLHSSSYVVKESQEFIDDFGKHKRNSDSYPELIHELLNSFHEAADALEKLNIKLEPEVQQMREHSKSPAALEKAHHDFLAKLQGLAK